MTGNEGKMSRRGLLYGSSGVLLAAAMEGSSAKAATSNDQPGMPQEGLDTPKLTMAIDADPASSVLKRIKQIGVNSVYIANMPPVPWTEDRLQKQIDQCASSGLKIGIIMIPWFKDGAMEPEYLKIVHGKPGRDEMIGKIKASIYAAGRVGIPVIEYNFFPHRAVEGYKVLYTGRGGSSHLSFDYDRMKDLPPLRSEGAIGYDEVWENYSYFLKEVVPVAEKAGVRLCVHPNDPPPKISRGSGQILNTFSDWKRLIETVNSPSNCITYDCGVTRELGEDPVEVCRYFASRDRIAQVHFRNVNLIKPNEKYEEVWNDEGQVNLLAVMKELVRNKYNRLIMPEHPPIMEPDKDLDAGALVGGYTGWVYNVAYAKAMLQAALMEVRGPRD